MPLTGLLDCLESRLKLDLCNTVRKGVKNHCHCAARLGNRTKPFRACAFTIAGTDLSFAVCDGIKAKAQNNRNLHITSINFDGPRCFDVFDWAFSVVAIHGKADQNSVAY